MRSAASGCSRRWRRGQHHHRRRPEDSARADLIARYIAFLRAINVGGHIVKMEQLRRLFESLGFSGVSTFIASGNVIFESRARVTAVLEQKIARNLCEALGYDVPTFIRTPAELAAIAGYDPFPHEKDDGEPRVLWVGLLPSQPGNEAREKFVAFRTETYDFHVHGREVYWLRRGIITELKIPGPRLEKAIGMPTTFRNITTVRKLAAMTSSETSG